MGEGENIKECISDVGEGVFLLAGIDSAIGAVGNLLVVVVGEPTVEVCVDCIDCILFVQICEIYEYGQIQKTDAGY